MEKKILVRIDTENIYVHQALKTIIESKCRHFSPIEIISKEISSHLPTILITREIRTVAVTPKQNHPGGFSPPVVVNLRGAMCDNPVVLTPCALNNLCIFHNDTVEAVSIVINHALEMCSSRLPPVQHCFRCNQAYLTQAECQFLRYFLEGRSPREIGFLIGRSIKTVSAQKRSIMKKLALKSDWELFHYFNGNRKP